MINENKNCVSICICKHENQQMAELENKTIYIDACLKVKSYEWPNNISVYNANI